MKRAFQKRYTTGLAAIRHQHGYSQAVFARLLGISKSLLAMAELGLRSLPAGALPKMASLEMERLQKKDGAVQPGGYKQPATDDINGIKQNPGQVTQ